MRFASRKFAWLAALGLAGLALAGCSQNLPAGPTPQPQVTQVAPSQTFVTPEVQPPTAVPTVEPPAARVNGQPISMSVFQAEVSRYEAGVASLGAQATPAPDYKRQVLDSLIDQTLIEQQAAAQKIAVSDQEVEAQVQGTIQDVGGQDKFNAWLQKNQWTPEQFRQVLNSQLLAQKVIAAVTANVPTTAEQVHARHIVVATEAEARALLQQLQAGARFEDLARQNSIDASTRDQGGDLGWFPRGLLTAPEVEQAAFALQPGQRSDVVKSSLGYHIIEVLERDPNRALPPDSVQQYRQQAFERWLADLRTKAQIERFAGG